MENDKPENPSRRGFLGAACAATGCGVGAFAGYHVVNYLIHPPQTTVSGPQTICPLSELPDGTAIKVEFRGGLLVMILRKGDALTAINASCTHLGCALDFDAKADRIRCNCHGGLFDSKGKVISGPPPVDQPEFPVKVEDGKIIVIL